MTNDDLISALTGIIPQQLTEDIVREFMEIRRDVSTSTLGKSSGGKFVETVCQIFQYLENGEYEAKPSVDKTLRNAESWTKLDEGIRICGARIARSMYALRSKRNMVHKGDIDPNQYDLAFLHHGAQWIVSELIRLSGGISKEEAGKLVSRVQVPIGGMVDDFNGKPIVSAKLSLSKEILVLMHHHYPNHVSYAELIKSMHRSKPDSIRAILSKLVSDRKLEPIEGKYGLTSIGMSEAIKIVSENI